jgi:hypothetical protein
MLTSLILFLLGLVALVIGVSMISVPAAWITGGLFCVVIAVARMIAVARQTQNIGS